MQIQAFLLKIQSFDKVIKWARAKLEIRSVNVYQKHQRRQVAVFQRILWWTRLLKRSLKISEYVSRCSVSTWIQCTLSKSFNNFSWGLEVEPQKTLSSLAFGKFDNCSQKKSKSLKNAISFKGFGRRYERSNAKKTYRFEISVKNCFT